MQRLWEHATYANTTATLALIIALGGTSYAALTLPRNSVGHRQLQAGAVRGPDVRNGSLGAKELSPGARDSLRGTQGPSGPQGPAGPAAAQYFAAVRANGERVAGNSTGGGSAGAVGQYVVAFSRAMDGCAATTTLGSTDSSTTVAGRITVNIVSGQLGVQTYAADGSPADLPFHVIAAC